MLPVGVALRPKGENRANTKTGLMGSNSEDDECAITGMVGAAAPARMSRPAMTLDAAAVYMPADLCLCLVD